MSRCRLIICWLGGFTTALNWDCIAVWAERVKGSLYGAAFLLAVRTAPLVVTETIWNFSEKIVSRPRTTARFSFWPEVVEEIENKRDTSRRPCCRWRTLFQRSWRNAATLSRVCLFARSGNFKIYRLRQQIFLFRMFIEKANLYGKIIVTLFTEFI